VNYYLLKKMFQPRFLQHHQPNLTACVHYCFISIELLQFVYKYIAYL